MTRAEAEPQALKQTPCGLCRVLRGSPCGDAGADGGTRTRDLFLTKEVLYLLSYISVCLVGGCLTALPLRGAAAGAAERGDAFASDAIDYMSFGGLCQ